MQSFSFDERRSWTVDIGGTSKRELLAALDRNGIALNRAAQILFAQEGFTTSEACCSVRITEITVAELGNADGATTDQIFDSASTLGMKPCPLELGPHFRLQFDDQAEGLVGHFPARHSAPPGSITVASLPLSEDDDVPKGFYLRRIEGKLWLRGYWSGADHVWGSQDQFVFCRD